MTSRPRLLLAGALLAVTAAGCTTPAPAHTTPATSAAVGTAGGVGTVPVYRRAAFGDGWADLDRDGCDTRQQIVRRDVTGWTAAPGCRITGGTLHDPYTGRTIAYRPGPALQVDHVYSLAAAWTGGAWRWTAPQRRRFANDPRNLLLVDGPTNETKSGLGPAAWSPDTDRGQCVYATAYQTVAAAYRLPITAPDRAALDRDRTHCPTTAG